VSCDDENRHGDTNLQVTYCSQTACIIVVTHVLAVSSCKVSLCSSRKSTSGRTMQATYAEAFTGTYIRQVEGGTATEKAI